MARTCDLCDKPHRARGLCTAHYSKQERQVKREARLKARQAELAAKEAAPPPPVVAPRRWWETPDPETGPTKPGPRDVDREIPLARPANEQERHLVTNLLTRHGQLQLADMLGISNGANP